jgi:hypothetical protein
MGIDEITTILESLGGRYALIGAHAMAARGYPRSTVDVDFLTVDSRVLEPAVWTDIIRRGGTVEPRRGDHEDPLAGVVHLQLADGSDFDVVVGRWTWEAAVVERAERMRIAGSEIPVARTSDLIMLKLAAGGFLDLRDAAVLLATGNRAELVREVEAHIDDVRPDIRPAWRELLAQTGPDR